jgi:prepilin-type N-terminal cleavage/methylation domain-containing protein
VLQQVKSLNTLHNSYRTSGFTLVEMLVVLLITAIISLSLFEVFGRTLTVRTRLAPFIDKVERTNLMAGWFRNSVQGLLPDEPKGQNRFKGQAQSFQGLSGNGLDQEVGNPSPVFWSLEQRADKTRLYYRGENQDQIIIDEWVGGGNFFYGDQKGQWYQNWPPSQDQSLWPQLPKFVRLDRLRAEQAWTILAVPRGPEQALSDQGNINIFQSPQ